MGLIRKTRYASLVQITLSTHKMITDAFDGDNLD